MDIQSLSSIRTDYTQSVLDEDSILHSPFLQFEKWFEEALKGQVMEPNAMSLSTINSNGHPSSRIVLLKAIEKDGFVFFTNYDSKKGKALQGHPFASLLFFWPELQRQVRIEGKVQQIPTLSSEEYFHSRPKGSQISAAASPQSQKIENRQFLENESERLNSLYKDAVLIPKPLNWGGYRLEPNLIEFWQGRASRLHDRIQYCLNSDGNWEISRLAP